MHYASVYGNTDIVKYLVDNGANIEAKGCDDMTPLYVSTKLEITKYLVDNGANID